MPTTSFVMPMNLALPSSRQNTTGTRQKVCQQTTTLRMTLADAPRTTRASTSAESVPRAAMSTAATAPDKAVQAPVLPNNRTSTEPIREVSGVEEYLRMLSSNADQLVVLKIFAPWCRSCRALTPKLNRLARELEDVAFFKMNFEENRDLCRRLGVHTMPTFILYYGKVGEIDKFSCGPSRAGVLRQKIEEAVRGYCELDDESREIVKTA